MSGAVLIFLAVVFGLLAARAALPAHRSWWRTRGTQPHRDEEGQVDEDHNDHHEPDPPATTPPSHDDDPLHIRRPPPEFPSELLRTRAPEPAPGTPEAALASWAQAMRTIHSGELGTARKWLDVDDVLIDDTGNLVVELQGLTAAAPIYPVPGMRVVRDDFARPAEVHLRIVELVRQVRARLAANVPVMPRVDDPRVRSEAVRLQRVLQNLAGLDPAARELVLQVTERLSGPAL